MQYYELQAKIFSKLLIFRHKWIRYFFHITILQIKSYIISINISKIIL